MEFGLSIWCEMKKLANIPGGIRRVFPVGMLIFFSIFNTNAQQIAPNTIDQTVFHRMKLGEYEITALSDGTVSIDLHQVLTGITGDKIDALTRASFQKASVETSVNAYLIKIGGKNILIDAGWPFQRRSDPVGKEPCR
jgi:hypothetical protein